MMSTTRTVKRLTWPEVDAPVRASLEADLGARVVEWHSQEEGFSPGMASRCLLEDGRRVFIKAVTSSINADSRVMACHEILVNRLMPDEAPAPRLLAEVDDGSWVAAAWIDVAGRLPFTPWTEQDLELVLSTLDDLALPPPEGIPPVVDHLDETLRGWRRLAEQAVTGIDGWIDAPTLGKLAEIEASWVEHCPPTALIHADIRADNILIDDQGNPWIVDWANAALGPPWFDLIGMIPSVTMQGGPEPAALWSASRHSSTTEAAAVDAVVVAIAGFFTEAARRPPVPQIPMLRDFQEAQARPARAWLRSRLGLD